jgi:hypothetical protein
VRKSRRSTAAEREEAVGGDLGDRYRGKLKSPNVKIAVDLVEKEIHDDSSKLHVEEDSNSKKARSIYVGQWDSIKEKMVWGHIPKNQAIWVQKKWCTWRL